MIILINVGMFVVSVIVFVIGIIGAIAVFEVEIEKRKRDVTKDEQDFLNWMRKIPSLRGELEIVNHPNCGQIRRWRIEMVNEANRILITDYKYHNYITIKFSGEIRGCNSDTINEHDEKDGDSFVIYDFKPTNKLSEFKQIYVEIVKELRIQKELEEEKSRAEKARMIIFKMRTG